MSQVLIRQALESALVAVPGGIAAAQTRWENATFTPTAGTPYQRVNLMPAAPADPVLGAGFRREQGLLQVALCFPDESGPGAADQAAELLKTWFPRGASFTKGSVTVIIERTPEVMPGFNEDDRWVVVVRVRYYANLYS